MEKDAAPDRKLFTQAADVTRKMNGHNDQLDLSVIKRCGEQLKFLCPASLAAFNQLPAQRRRAARAAVKAAFQLDSLPTPKDAYGKLASLRGDCKVPENIKDPTRTNLNRLFQYVASTVMQ